MGTQEGEVTFWWFMRRQSCPSPDFAPTTSPDPLECLGAERGRAPTPPLPSRSLSTDSGENQRNKLEASPPLSHLAEICRGLRNSPGMGGQTQVLPISPLFLQSRQGTAVTVPMARPAQPHTWGESLQQEGRMRMRALGKLHVFAAFYDFQSPT